MQLADVDENVSCSECFLSWYIDPLGRTLNEEFALEVNKELEASLRRPNVACEVTSLSLRSQPSRDEKKGSCDISVENPKYAEADIEPTQFVRQSRSQSISLPISYSPKVEGFTRYLITLARSSDNISLFCADLRILSVSATLASIDVSRAKTHEETRPFLSSHTTYETARQRATFWFPAPLPSGIPLNVAIYFTFDLGSYWCGMYIFNPKNLPGKADQTQLDTAEGKTHTNKLLKFSDDRVVATQFESVGARRAFPSFDSPNRKISYTIRIITIPEVTLCVSNMDLELYRVMSKGSGFQLFQFKPTPPLPSYLLAIVLATQKIYTTTKQTISLPAYGTLNESTSVDDVCPSTSFELAKEAVSNHKVQLRVIGPFERKEDNKFILQNFVDVLTYLWTYFRVSLPLNKLDLITLSFEKPSAMENYGLCTFREEDLMPSGLSAPGFGSIEHFIKKVGSLKVLAHEIAHHWTGNLVTASHWNELWMNEGFATFLASKTVDNLQPSFHAWERFVATDVKMMREIDWLSWKPKLFESCKQPVDQERCTELEPFAYNRTVIQDAYFFKTIEHVEAVFDAITYTKGAALLRCIEGLIGTEAFQHSLHFLLKQRALASGSFADFAQILDHTCPRCQKVAEWKTTDGGTLKISQIIEPYLKQPGFPILVIDADIDKLTLTLSVRGRGKTQLQRWPIPLFRARQILTSSSHIFTFTSREELWRQCWPNQDGLGYYVTVGTERTQDIIRASLNAQSRLDKIALLDDLFFATRHRFIPFTVLAKLLPAFQAQNDPILLFYILTTFQELTVYYQFVPKILDHCRLIGGILQNMAIEASDPSLETDSKLVRFLREQVREWLSKPREGVDDVVQNLLAVTPQSQPLPSSESSPLLSTSSERESTYLSRNQSVQASIDILLKSLISYFDGTTASLQQEGKESKEVKLLSFNREANNHFALQHNREVASYQSVNAFPWHPKWSQSGAQTSFSSGSTDHVVGREIPSVLRNLSRHELPILLEHLQPQMTSTQRLMTTTLLKQLGT